MVSTDQSAADAELLAIEGFRVFPIPRGEKAPRVQWRAWATANVISLGAMWPDGPSNIGIATAGLFVLDVDANKDGLAALERLKAAGHFPKTRTHRSARGGLHVIFRIPKGSQGVASRACRKMPDGRAVEALPGFYGIDIRGEGGYIVGPGSEFEGKPYSVEIDAPIADAPQWLIDLAVKPRERSADAGRIVGEADNAEAIAAATQYLQNEAPESVEGAGGDATAYQVMCRVLDFGITPATAAELAAEHWNERCAPAWDHDELVRKAENAARYRQDAIGRDNPDLGDVFAEVPEPPAASLIRRPSEIDRDAILARQSGALIKGMLSPGDLGVIYGDSGAGKTFLALHLAWQVARGERWIDRRTTAAPVLYVSLEGAHGFEKRLFTAREVYGDPGANLAELRVPVSLARDDAGRLGVETIALAHAELTGAQRGGLIVIDTLARAMAGDDENDTGCMTAFVERRAGEIARRTGAAVLIVHHTNKQGTMRGSNVLLGAADLVLRAQRDGNERELIAEKVKDGVEGRLMGYVLAIHELGRDADGDLVTSCTVEAEMPESPTGQAMVAVFEAVANAHGAGKPLATTTRGRGGAAYLIAEMHGGGAETKQLYETILTRLENAGRIVRAPRADGVEAWHVHDPEFFTPV